jgi:hypothetical protein
MSIAVGSYVWYTRKNCIVKVLEYDRCSDSYTIEFKGKIIDTLAKFIDTNIGSKCMIFHDEKLELEGKITELESYVSNLKEKNRADKQKFEAEKREIDSYVSVLVHERTMLEADMKNLNQKLLDYRNMYEKSVKSLLVKGETTKETIIMNNCLKEKTGKFLWNDIDLYSDFEGLKKYLVGVFNIATRVTSSVGNCTSDTVSEFKSWSLQKKEYIVGVYYSLNKKSRDSIVLHNVTMPRINKENCHNFQVHVPGGYIFELIFYTNYGNIISIIHYADSTRRAREVNKFTINKILSSRMINIINKSISSGFNDLEQLEAAKSGEELYDFIKDLVNM